MEEKKIMIDNVQNNLIGTFINNGVIPSDIFIESLMYVGYDMEFKSKIKYRNISTFFNQLLEEYATYDLIRDRYNINEAGLVILNKVIESRFTDKWTRLRDLWNMHYDPLSPFDITLNEETTNELEVNEDTSSSSSDTSIYGFNSEEKVPTDSSKNSSENKYSRSNPTTRDYTRKGNIGNTSRQELVQQEREVLRYQLIDTIYNDIASVICRGKYY